MVLAGPQAAGFEAGCWRTPMIQDWIKRRFGVMYNVHYLSEWLGNLGLSYQKAKFESDHLSEPLGHKWPSFWVGSSNSHWLILSSSRFCLTVTSQGGGLRRSAVLPASDAPSTRTPPRPGG